jgi:hypothetical protein
MDLALFDTDTQRPTTVLSLPRNFPRKYRFNPLPFLRTEVASPIPFPQIKRLGPCGFHLWVGAHLYVLTDLDGYEGAVSWSPDGRWVAFNLGPRDGSGSQSLVKMRVGSCEEPIPLAKSFCDFAPSWSPDGQRILCSARGVLYTISADGGEPDFLGEEYEPLAVWSRDIRYIYAIRDADGRRQLGQLDWKGGAFQPIVDVPLELVIRDRSLYTVRLSLAPDGKSLATTIQKPSGDIWILDGFQPPPTLFQRLVRC